MEALTPSRRTHIHIEDLGPEENLHGVNPLPVASPLLLMDVISTGGNVDELNYLE